MLAVGFAHAIVPAGKGVRDAFDCLGEGLARPDHHCGHLDGRQNSRRIQERMLKE